MTRSSHSGLFSRPRDTSAAAGHKLTAAPSHGTDTIRMSSLLLMGCSCWFWLYNYEQRCCQHSPACTRVSQRDRPKSRTAGPPDIHVFNQMLPKRLSHFTRPPAASVSSCCLLSMAGNIQQFTSCQRLAVKWDLTIICTGISWLLIRLALLTFTCRLCFLIYEMPVSSFWSYFFSNQLFKKFNF